MTLQMTIAAPLIALAVKLALSSRRDPARRSRQEAAWRDLIRDAGINDF